MISIEFINNSDISEGLKLQICEFKNRNWEYPVQSHLDWMDTHLCDDDIHLLLKEDDVPVAYLNMVCVNLEYDSRTVEALGIGNVCVDPAMKGRNYGRLIMSVADFYCRQNKMPGILFCQEKNVGFYRTCNWIPYDGDVEVEGKSLQAYCFLNQALSTRLLSVNRDF
jgi:GNAT superfamily N-acetyltransferase